MTSGVESCNVLGTRALNRATLERQLLLRRSKMSALDAIGHFVGMQAQTPHSWYVGLWTRLEGLDPKLVAELLTKRPGDGEAVMMGKLPAAQTRQSGGS